MNKILGLGLAAALATAGAAYYVGPDADGPGEIPPILVEGAPAEVLAKVRRMSVSQFLQHRGVGDRDAGLLRSSTTSGPDGEIVTTMSLASDRVLILRARARAASAGKTELDIVAEMPESRLSAQPALHPYDLKVLALLADLIATDYVSSRLTGQRMITGTEFEKAMAQRTGFDREEERAFGKRLSEALAAAYSADFADVDYDRSAYRDSDWGEMRRGNDWNTRAAASEAAADKREVSRVEQQTRRNTYQAEQAARRAAYEAERAARRAAVEAQRAARY